MSYAFWASCRTSKKFWLSLNVVVVVVLFVLTQGTMTAPTISAQVQADNAAIKFD